MSETANELIRALSLLQSRCGGMAKSGRNTHLRSEYSTLKDAWAVVRPHLAELGLSITQWPICEDGKAGALTEVEHVSGFGKECRLLLPIPKGNNQIHAIGSAVTYARRFTLLAACGLAEDEHDDDGNIAGYVPPAVRNPSKCMDEALAARDPNRPKRIPPVRRIRDAKQAELLDDTRDAILALVPKLPADQQDGAKTSANGAHAAADLGYLENMLGWVEREVLPKEVKA